MAATLRCARLQSNHYRQNTNTRDFIFILGFIFTGRMHFMLPNEQYQSTEGVNT